MNTQQINTLIKERANAGQIATDDISDGYHTFGELYNHRIALYILLAKTLSSVLAAYRKHAVWRSKKHSDGSELDGWFVLGIYKNEGEQITYHLPISEWDKCEFAETLELAPEWDGHTGDDVLVRLNDMIYSLRVDAPQKHVTASGYSNDPTRQGGLS